MWITNSDRDLKVLYYEPEEQELRTVPNIINGKIQAIVLYLDDIMLSDYDTLIDALQEMKDITNAYLEGYDEYQVKDYELSKNDQEFVSYIAERYREAFMPDDDTIFEGWANL